MSPAQSLLSSPCHSHQASHSSLCHWVIPTGKVHSGLDCRLRPPVQFQSMSFSSSLPERVAAIPPAAALPSSSPYRNDCLVRDTQQHKFAAPKCLKKPRFDVAMQVLSTLSGSDRASAARYALVHLHHTSLCKGVGKPSVDVKCRQTRVDSIFLLSRNIELACNLIRLCNPL